MTAGSSFSERRWGHILSYIMKGETGLFLIFEKCIISELGNGHTSGYKWIWRHFVLFKDVRHGKQSTLSFISPSNAHAVYLFFTSRCLVFACKGY